MTDIRPVIDTRSSPAGGLSGGLPKAPRHGW